MTDREIICVMMAVGLIMTFTITGSVILDAKIRHRQVQDDLNSRYDGPIFTTIPMKGTVE